MSGVPTFDNAKTIVLLGGVALAGFLAYQIYTKGKTVVTETLNPASDKNVVNQGVNSAVQAVTGDENATLGTKIYDWLNPNESKKLGLQKPAQPASAETAMTPNSFTAFLDRLKQSTFQW